MENLHLSGGRGGGGHKAILSNNRECACLETNEFNQKCMYIRQAKTLDGLIGGIIARSI